MDKLDNIIQQEYLPSNLDEAVIALKQILEKETRRVSWNILEDFSSKDCEHAISSYHHDLGRWIRNNWKLWDKTSVLSQWFINELNAQHPDDISSIILDALWADLNSKPRRTQKLLNEYKIHWDKFGDPGYAK